MSAQKKSRGLICFSIMLCLHSIILVGVYMHLILTERREPFSGLMITFVFFTFGVFVASAMLFIWHRQEQRSRLLLEQEEEQQKQLIATNQK